MNIKNIMSVLTFCLISFPLQAESESKLAQRVTDLEEMVEYLDEELENVNKKSQSSKAGLNNVVLAGYMYANYFDVSKSETDAFAFGMAPVFLYRINDRLLTEIEIEATSSTLALEYAQITYLLNDKITLGAGKFLLPLGNFGERLHPTWINRLPDAPKAWAHGEGFVPMTDIGFQLRGGTEIGSKSKINYAVYISNGPQLDTASGTLSFANTTENNGNKAVGGRFGFLPRYNMEFGLSFMSAQSGSESFSSIDSSFMGADFSYFNNGLTLRAEWVQLDVDNTLAILNGEQNKRSGLYLQASYRFKGKLEGVVRYDEIDLPESLNDDESRITLGVNYWINESSAFKVAYRLADNEDSTKEANAILTQFTMGF